MEKFILTTDNSQDTLSKALGISDKRKEKIAASLSEHTNNPEEPSLSEALSNVVKDCETLEEVVYAAFAFGEHVGEGQGGDIGSLLATMGAFAGDPSEDEDDRL